MTNKEAIMMLNLKTTASALAEIYYNGFSGKEACIEAIEDACRLAIEALEKQIPKKPTHLQFNPDGFMTLYCPNCGDFHRSEFAIKFCSDCGQAIDWSYDVDTEYEAYQDEMGGMAEVAASEVE